MKYFLLLFSAFLLACNAEKVSLSFGRSENDSQIYRITASLSGVALGGDSSQPEKMHSELALVSTNILETAFDDGSLAFLFRVDSASYSSDTRSTEERDYIARTLETQNFRYKIASDGMIRSAPELENFKFIPGFNEIDIRKLFLKLQPVLPGKPVSLGESWERQSAFHEGDAQTIVYKNFQLEDVFLRDSKKLAKVGVRIRYRQIEEDDILKMESEGFLVGAGTLLFNVIEGAIEEANMEISGNLKVSDKVASKKLPDLNVRQILKMQRL